MSAFIKWTYHAAQRLEDRSVMHEDDVESILKEGKYVLTGVETSSNRQHIVLYSLKDEIHYTCILDEKTQEIITFLPVDFHENISWKISIDALLLAERLARGLPPEAERPETPEVKANPACTPPTKLRISAYIFTHEGPKMKTIGSIEYTDDIADLSPDLSFLREVKQLVVGKGICLDAVNALKLEQGKRKKRILDITGYDIEEILTRHQMSRMGPVP